MAKTTVAKKAKPKKSNASGKAPVKTAQKANAKPAAKAPEKAAAKPAAHKTTSKDAKAAEVVAAKQKTAALVKPDPKTDIKPDPAAKSKKAKPAKPAKKQDADDDLLAGEADGSEEDLGDIEEMAVIEELEVEEEPVEAASLDDSDDEEDEVVAAGDDEEIVLTDAEGRRLCRVRDCDQAAVVETYCRFHYLQNWKRIQVRRKILADGKLERYVEELTSRYPDKFLEMIRKDLRSEKDFMGSIAELEIDESGMDSEFEDESQSFIDEVRGVSETVITEDEEF